MTKTEFMGQLRACLYTLPPDEREAALQFYEEYFDDAGVENEQRVLEELGPPYQVAEQIMKGCDVRYSPPAYTPRNKKSNPWWMFFVGVLAFPIAFPLLITVIALGFTAVVVVAALVFALVITVVALLLGGMVGLVAWFAALGGLAVPFVTIPTGITGLGLMLCSLGLGLLLIWPASWLFTRGIPMMWGGFRKMWRAMTTRRKWGK